MFDARTAYVQGTHGRFVIWSAVFIWGPAVLWFDLIGVLIYCGVRWQRLAIDGKLHKPIRWQLFNQILMTLVRDTLIGLIALTFYQKWGGVIPFAADWINTILPAVYSLLIYIGLLLILMGVVYRVDQYGRTDSLIDRGQRLLKFVVAVSLFYLVPAPLGVVAAGFYSQVGVWAYFAFWIILFLLSLLTNYVNKTAVQSRSRAGQLYQLEQLARNIMQDPVDSSDLPTLLAKYVPAIFDDAWIEIRLFPNHILFAQGEGWIPLPDDVWQGAAQTEDSYQIIHGMPEAVANGFADEAMLIPVIGKENRNVGTVYLMRLVGEDVRAWEAAGLALAAQIAADLARVQQYHEALASQAEAYEKEVYEQAYQAEVYAQALAYEKVSKELAAAGQIQETFLPDGLPDLAGWQIAVTLEPARETSGDFYDFIPLSNGRIGLIVADVADKGMGAALYMALSRTLIRIYAVENEMAPELALSEANSRILADTTSDLFVTVFYAILDPESGELTYCNAGHNPPFILSPNGVPMQLLTRTALPVGLFEDMPWEQGKAKLDPGDVLVMYSDGVTEAEDEEQDYFGEDRLMSVAKANMGRSAEVIESKVVTAVTTFVGDAPQMDDITLMILTRETSN
ncbi:MAG: PP2C family protein-serine/threonine phosphatase [Chloroflexi bacterium]|nr:PP2C family protein-serine/threonine phosphatase [Chloroflexota bacterium]